MDTLSRLFGAVADPTRLAVLLLLIRHGERCVCEIHTILGVSQSRASRALKELRLAGLVADRRVGTWIHYRLPEAPAAAPARLIEAVAGMATPADTAALDERVRAYGERKPEECRGTVPALLHPASRPTPA